MRALVAILLTISVHAAEPYYGVTMVQARALWRVTKGAGVKVAIVDTGIDATHPALQAAYRGGYDFVHDDATPEEETSEAHGTFVAGVVLQVAPDAQIYALKIFGKENSFETSDFVHAIDWAIAHHIDVLNLSFAAKVHLDDVRHALERAEAAGIVVVAAAGNAAGAVDYPAAFDSAIAVGAVDHAMNVASFSNHGWELDLATPGVDVYSLAAKGSGLVATINDNIYATSFLGARLGDVTGALIDCGAGRREQIPASLVGNVALVRLDPSYPFGDALGNLVRGRASAIIVANSEPRFFYTNVNPPGVLPPVASIGSDDVARLGATVHVVSAQSDFRFGYGTSYASPHVAGVVALL
ncbi:MAG TPA: S8 family serine peptidase, partial [Thermoanaerobaculia bacterium]|nr:S8 family serine peptidase [Thermoanaerobaculia bacterium]